MPTVNDQMPLVFTFRIALSHEEVEAIKKDLGFPELKPLETHHMEDYLIRLIEAKVWQIQEAMPLPLAEASVSLPRNVYEALLGLYHAFREYINYNSEGISETVEERAFMDLVENHLGSTPVKSSHPWTDEIRRGIQGTPKP